MAAYAPDGLPDMTEDLPPQTNGDHSYDQQEGGDEDEDYDPSSFNFGDGATEKPGQHMPSAPGATSAVPQYQRHEKAARPKTVGGFIMEESDDDDDDDEEEDSIMTSGAPPPPSQLNDSEGAQSGLGAVAVHEAAGEDVQLASEPTQDSAAAQQLHADSLNGSTASSAMTTTTPLPTDAVQSTIAPAVSQPALSLTTAQHDEGKQAVISPAADAGTISVAAASKPSVNRSSVPSDSSVVLPAPTSQRLPHDKVGRLEDRIKEDPKADVDAWWELIHHYRDKDQLDNARRVFDRMLEVWPTSVCIANPSSQRFASSIWCLPLADWFADVSSAHCLPSIPRPRARRIQSQQDRPTLRHLSPYHSLSTIVDRIPLLSPPRLPAHPGPARCESHHHHLRL